MISKKQYKNLEKENQLARAKKAWFKQQQKEAVENYRKMIGRGKKSGQSE